MKKFLIINFVAMLFACNFSMKALHEAENVNPNASKNSNPNASKKSMTEKINEDKTSFTSNIARQAFDPNFQKTDKPLSSSTEKSTTANPVNKPANTGGIKIELAPTKNDLNEALSDAKTAHGKLMLTSSKPEITSLEDGGQLERSTGTFKDGTTYEQEIVKNFDGSIATTKITISTNDTETQTTTGPTGNLIKKKETINYPDGKTVETTSGNKNVFQAYNKFNKKISEVVTQDGQTITKEYNPETGNKTTETTVKSDGTVIEATKNGTRTTNPDGSATEEVVQADGTKLIIETSNKGRIQQTSKNVDGSINEKFKSTLTATASQSLLDVRSEVVTPESIITAQNILGIGKNNMDKKSIMKAYKDLSLQTHPDKNVNNPTYNSDDYTDVQNAKDLLLKDISAA